MDNKAFDENLPRCPKHLSKYAKVCLQSLNDAHLGKFISIGGGLGLLHYLDYRTTHDVDAWWTSKAKEEDKKKVIDKIQQILDRYGPGKIGSRDPFAKN